LEQVLFYFHTTRRADVDKLEPFEQNMFLANVDCSATSAFLPLLRRKRKQTQQMLEAKAV